MTESDDNERRNVHIEEAVHAALEAIDTFIVGEELRPLPPSGTGVFCPKSNHHGVRTNGTL